MEMTKENLQRWARDWEEVNELQRQAIAREPRLTAAEYFKQALDLLAFAEKFGHVDPFTYPDPVREARKQEVIATWVKLRERWKP